MKNTFEYYKQGFGLLEFLISMAIFVVIGGALFLLQKDVLSSNNFITNGLFAQNEARRFIKVAIPEIRTAILSSIGDLPVTEAKATSLTIYSNVDDDNLRERIRYFLDGTLLKKGVIKPTGNPLVYNLGNEQIDTVVHDVANGGTAIFEYYDNTYDGTTAPLTLPAFLPAIRLIKVTVIIDNDATRPPAPFTATTQVTIRSVKDNL